MGLRVLDADHAVDAVGERLRQPEQVGARVVHRVGAVAVMLEDVIDQLVEAFPPGARVDGHHRRARRDGRAHQRGGGLFDEDGHRHALARLPAHPSHRLVVGDPQQEEDVGGARRGRETQAHVVGVDQRGRTHRQVQATGRIGEADQGRVQREQQLTQPHTGHVV